MAEINNNNAKAGQERQCPAGYKNCDGYIIPNEWSVVRFSSLFKRLTRKNAENNQNVLTISAQQGLVSQMDYYNTLYASENKEGYSLLHKGDFSYNKSYSSDYAYGAIKRLDAYDSGIVSPLYICFTPQDGTNSDFYLQYFEAGHFNREIYKIAQEGARNHGLLNVSTEDFFNSSLIFPPLAEQKRIADILMQCDKVIELKLREIEELEKLKKAYLKMLFPQKGYNEPVIRFPGFSGMWKRHKLGEIGSVQTCKRIFKEQTTEKGEIPFYKNGTIGLQADAYISREVFEEFKRLYPYPEPGDILISAVGSVGRTAEYTGKDEYFQDSNVVWLKIDKMAVDKKFLKASYQVIDWLIEGSTVKHLYNDNILKSAIWIPGTIAEQKAVGKFVEEFDNLIALRRCELEESKKKRKALAQLLLTGIVRTKA